VFNVLLSKQTSADNPSLSLLLFIEGRLKKGFEDIDELESVRSARPNQKVMHGYENMLDGLWGLRELHPRTT
jgi:hypothetical protein